MVQRDYILRLIEQLGPGAAALLRSAEQRKGQQYGEAGRTIDQTLRQYFGLDSGAVRGLSAEELVALVRLGHSPLVRSEALAEKLVLLASILAEQADLDAAQNDPEGSADCALKSLQIFLVVLTEEDPHAERALAALDPLLRQLAAYDLPTPTKEQLWRHFERSGEFARAEDWLFALLDDAPDVLPEGIAFYDRLAWRTDDELARGNLPRDEVAAGLAELRAREG
jgi:hypothetical protein